MAPDLPPSTSARDRILEAVRAMPGVTKSELLPVLGLAWATVSYHVRVLHERQQLALLGHGRKVALFPVGYSKESMLWTSCLRTPQASQVARFFADQREGSIAAVSLRQGVSRRIARRGLRELVEAGVLTVTTSGRPRFTVKDGCRAKFEGLAATAPLVSIVPPNLLFATGRLHAA